MDAQANLSRVFTGLLSTNGVINNFATTNAKSLGNAVHKFEAYFIQTMLKSMRSASLAKGLFESDKVNFYRDWHDQKLADNLSSKENFAIAKLLRQQFGGEPVQPTPSTSIASSHIFRRSSHANVGKSAAVNKTHLKQSIIKEVTKPIVNPRVIPELQDLTGPEKFIYQIYPYAQKVASKLNTSADVLIAIAALETGWGNHTPKFENGKNSNNYFGIKAHNWNGDKIEKITSEFDGEKMIQVKDSFRVYASPEDSFKDFAEFLLANPRYKNAIITGRNSETFVHELQKAGYATDPKYAEKVISILNSDLMKGILNAKTKSELMVYSYSQNQNLESTN